ncbi:hypothetical protein [Sphingomonas sp. T9W2]|uniref:hypothetical protein n=1 Tax=Sphingomonas sp. T9W2 TaxID=3143183 RepID=UPI0031F4FE29
MTEDVLDRTRRDLTTATIDQIQSVVNTRANIAAAVLPSHQIAMMLVDIAAATLSGACVFVIQNAHQGSDVDDLAATIIQGTAETVTGRLVKMKAVAAALRRGEPGPVVHKKLRNGTLEGIANHG